MSAAPTRRAAGFTLIELIVVMGILSGFLVMLVSLVDSGLTMFRDGETSQVLADRGARAQQVVRDELSRLRGSATGRDREQVEDRLVVQVLPIGLPYTPARGATLVQVLRGAVHLSPDRELQIVGKRLAAEVLEEDPTLTPEELVAEADKRAATEPLRGIGNLMLLPWRQEGDDDALLELRAGWFLPGQRIPSGPDRFVDPFDVVVPGGEELPGVTVFEMTTPILSDLLHVEFGLWSQRTTSWGDERGPLHGFQSGATSRLEQPQAIWDSARGGWLVDAATGGEFAFDLGPLSESDPTDDIHPHAILCRVVVAQDRDAAPEGLLARFAGTEDTTLYLYDGTAFPGRRDGGYVKLAGEWIRYASLDGDRLVGCKRGQRGTKLLEHAAGAAVNVGRTVEFVVPVLHAKDDWNG
ncbi:MAG: PulJ/GspJ family protein [Planctomycetota bacterium]